MPNMGQIINAHNKKILKENRNIESGKKCNCKKVKCPISDNKNSCRKDNVVYQAEVKTDKETKTYIGLTSMEFKQRWYKHRSDFLHKENKDSTRLSSYIWNLKDNNIKFEIKWNIIKKVNPIKNGDKICRLCTSEAELIMKSKDNQLNKRTEVMNKCKHRNQFLLKNWKKKKTNQ